MYRNPGSRTGIMRHTTPAPIGLVTLLITSAATLAAPPVQATERVLTPREPSRRVWHQLQELSQAEKANARIQLEIAAGTEPLVCPDTADIEQAWNRGEHDRAIDQLRRLEEAGFEAAVAVDWIAPESVAEADWGPDARIGTRIDLSSLEFDFHEETGRLFVVTEYATCDSEQTSWAVWMSTDGGRNWARTFTCYADLCTRGVAAAVAGDYLYVAYLWVLCELEVRRFFAATGSADHGYGVKVAFARGCDREPTSWAMTSNADSYDTNVYLVAAACDGSLRYAYATAPLGVWNERSTGVRGALYGLDASFCYAGDYYLYASYVGENPSGPPSNPLRVARYDGSAWDVADVESNPRLGSATRIAAYRNWVMTVHEYDLFPYGVGVRYRVSYDGGDTWKVGTVAQPDEDHYYQRPDVTARRGMGFAVSYLQGRLGPWQGCWFRRRAYGSDAPGSAPWSDPEQVSSYLPVTAQPTRVEYLPPPANCDGSYGTLFVANPVAQGVYFNRTDIGCRSPTVPADFDKDGDVDVNDYAYFQACFNGPGRPPAPNCGADADFDDDGDVDVNDFAVFQACFNGSGRPPACQ